MYKKYIFLVCLFSLSIYGCSGKNDVNNTSNKRIRIEYSSYDVQISRNSPTDSVALTIRWIDVEVPSYQFTLSNRFNGITYALNDDSQNSSNDRTLGITEKELDDAVTQMGLSDSITVPLTLTIGIAGNENTVTANTKINVTFSENYYKNPVVDTSLPDPTVIRANGNYYLYATEDIHNVPIMRSEDMIHWKQIGTVFTDQTRPTFVSGGGIWAPDIEHINGKYVLYYAMSVWGGEWGCGIGVATADSPEGPFTNLGKLFTSNEVGVQNSIDPCYIEDNGKKYLIWGSFHGIYAIQLTDDGLQVKEGSKPIQIVGTAYEGSYVFKRGNYYYYFGSNGTCCDGLKSTYRVVYGRSTSLFGPYVDKEGESLMNNKYDVLINANSYFVGNGHDSGIVQDDAGQDWMFYHGYVRSTGAGRDLMLSQIKWDKDGWPYIVGGSPQKTAQIPFIRKNKL
jgi:arabinan endo-1,5-alpha-L-arabinosidase